MENPLIIFGAKGLAKSALEIFRSHQVTVYGFLDDDSALHQQSIDEIPILGSTDDEGFLKLIGRKCEAFVALEERKIRQKIVEMLIERRKVMPVNAIHAKAYLATSASIGHGNMIDAQALLNSHVQMGSHCLVQAGALIDYESHIEDFVHIGLGARIGSQVHIEEGAFIGAGATIVSGLRIGKNARIGAGSVVIQSVDKNSTVFGVPAQKV